jgi:phosphoserine aminotransferase
MKMYNFNSGPAVLPGEVLQQASEAIINFDDLGLSILEIGHRTEWFVNVLEEAKALIKELMQIDGLIRSIVFARGCNHAVYAGAYEPAWRRRNSCLLR